jgi:hypothetical protein
MNGIAILDFELNDFARPLNIMNPESQKIGNPVINPVTASADELLFSPVLDRIYFAILIVPPVMSRVIPMIAPSIIRKPMDPIVFPNPCLSVLTIVLAGKVANARKIETRKRAMNAFNFNFEVSIIMAIILIPTKIDVNSVLMEFIYVEKRYATNIVAVNPARSSSNPQSIEYLVFFMPIEPK